ncbi:MAG: tRNA (adenosine(37)-N6)-dimethylallyltransferase MiaA [Phycisphaerales bacterium]
MLPRMPVIVGPTAGGKTGLAVRVAHALIGLGHAGTEIVSADSMMVYRGMDIGTAKPSDEDRRGVPHRLIDVVDPHERFNLELWLDRAERAIDEIRAPGGVPIVVGGTHLYVKALLEGLFEGPSADDTIRAELTAMDPTARRALLERVDPESAGRIHANDVRRTVRALEVWKLTGAPISAQQSQWDEGRARDDAVLVGLVWSSEGVNRRINARVKAMVDAGFVEEARGLWEAGAYGEQSREALGYKQFIAHFEGRCSLEEAIERIKIETRRFAKNQRTWLRRLRATPGSVWIEMEETSEEIATERIVRAVLGGSP